MRTHVDAELAHVVPLGNSVAPRRPSRNRSSARWLPCVGLLCILGCASFPGGQLPTVGYDQLAPAVQRTERPSIDYDITFTTSGSENAAASELFEKRVQEVFTKSSAFSSVSAGLGSQPFHVSLTLDNSGSSGLAALSGMITGLSLMVIPGYARDNYRLSATLSSAQNTLKEYEYRDHLSTWFHLFLVFLTPSHSPQKVVFEVVDNMLLNLLHDIHRDQILTVPQPTEAGAAAEENR